MTNPNGRFGIHGGQYIPETLMNAVIELEEAYNHYKNDPEFNRELTELFNEYAGRPSRLYYAEKMTKDLGGAKIYLKRDSKVSSSFTSPDFTLLFTLSAMRKTVIKKKRQILIKTGLYGL